MVIGSPAQRLHDEIGHHAPVGGVHARAVGVEDPRDLDLELVLAVIIEEQGLGAALALVIAAARADRVDVAPIVFGLRVDRRIAIDFAGRCLEDPRVEPLGQPQHVDRAVDRGLGRLDRIVLIMDRRRGAGEIVDFVDLDIERQGHVVAHELELRMAGEMRDIVLGAGEQIVDAQHVVPAAEQGSHRCEPRKPAPPVTRTRLREEYCLVMAG